MTKIISEIGINHNGSVAVCKKMVLESFRAGSWGIKFQYRNLERYIKNSKKTSEIGLEIIDKEIKRNYLKPKDIIKISKYAKKLGLKVGISYFYQEDLFDFKKYNFDFYKIPSAVALDIDLIKSLSKKNKKILISLGSKTENDILFLKKKINFERIKNIVLLHCTSNYPLNPINANIGFIDRLKKIFPNNQIGYSSHENDIYNCIISLTKNIDFIERHYTLDKNSTGLDHTSSSNFEEMEKLCFYAKNINLISSQKIIKNLNQGEKINLQNLGKSAYSLSAFKKGEKIKLSKIYFKSPKIGLSSIEVSKYIKKKLLKDLLPNEPITIEHFVKHPNFNLDLITFMNSKNLSIPIRPHDYFIMHQIFNSKNYEFHLSFNDVNNFDIKKINKLFLKNKRFSVHGPDYCNENNILDIFSNNKIIKKISRALLIKSVKICKSLENVSGNKVLMIQSFSSDNKNINKLKYYLLLKKYIKYIEKKFNILILPQWLPPYAWYFGGSVKMFLFCNPKDLLFLNKNKIKICMDLSHFTMSCNYYQEKLNRKLKQYQSLFYHYHLSDASGIDSEGLPLGEGDLIKDNLNNLRKIINSKKVKVLETWQGHLNDGYIFKSEISKLKKIL